MPDTNPMPDTTDETYDPADVPVIIGETGSFEITGFRTKKFENHEEDATKVDTISESPAIARAFRLFSGKDSN
jgi:hypothetical protein